MRNLKSVLGVIGALAAILYCGRLLYYFLDLSGSVQEAETDGLGPTLLGLGAVGLLFCVVLVVKLVRMFGGPRSSGSGGGGGPSAPMPDDDGGFDADAVLARYMAQRPAGAAPGSPAAPPARDGGGSATRPSFGRKGR